MHLLCSVLPSIVFYPHQIGISCFSFDIFLIFEIASCISFLILGVICSCVRWIHLLYSLVQNNKNPQHYYVQVHQTLYTCLKTISIMHTSKCLINARLPWTFATNMTFPVHLPPCSDVRAYFKESSSYLGT